MKSQVWPCILRGLKARCVAMHPRSLNGQGPPGTMEERKHARGPVHMKPSHRTPGPCYPCPVSWHPWFTHLEIPFHLQMSSKQKLKYEMLLFSTTTITPLITDNSIGYVFTIPLIKPRQCVPLCTGQRLTS